MVKSLAISCLLYLSSTATSVLGQSEGIQVWTEYNLHYPFANIYNLEYNGRYATIFGAEKWRSFQNRLSIGRAVGGRADLSLTELLSYTNQKETYNTLELRTTLGFRYHFTPDRRVLTRIYLRAENRQVKDLTTEQWTATNRLRIRPEIMFPLTGKTMFADKIFYAIIDGEWLVPLDEDQEETYANRFRSRLGVGYRLDYSFRFEFIYSVQASRNTVEETFDPTASIFRLRVKQYLRKSKPVQQPPESDH